MGSRGAHKVRGRERVFANGPASDWVLYSLDGLGVPVEMARPV